MPDTPTVVYHIGLHATDEDKALRCLLKNARVLAETGTVIALPGRFRPAMREALLQLRGAPADAELQRGLLDRVLDDDPARRILFSHDSFLCVPKRAVLDGRYYPVAAERLPWIRNLFPGMPCEFAIALRNPATLLPALHARFQDKIAYSDYLARVQPQALDWAAFVAEIRAAVPDCKLTIWANEDTPLIWPDVLQALSGHPPGLVLEGVNDLLSTIMSEEGLGRMVTYLDSHPPRTPEHRRRIVSAFLDKFAIEEAIEIEYDLPGWTENLIAELTARYEAQLAQIAAMDGITFLSA